MDLRCFSSDMSGDLYRYAAPESFEILGKEFPVVFDGGERVLLKLPAADASNADAERGVRCAKIADNVWLVAFGNSELPAAYVLDLGAGLVTRAVMSSNGGFALSFGAIENAGDARHAVTDELAGNTVEWTFGVGESSVIRVSYGDSAVELTRPRAPDAQKLTATSFRAVKITETIYLQTVVVADGKANVCLLSDFSRVLCIGCVFGLDNAVRMIAGYGVVTE